MQLTPTRLRAGVWEGVLTGATEPPLLEARHLGQAVPGLRVTPRGSDWAVEVPVPPEALSDGVQTILICVAATGEVLARFTLLAGTALDEDLRAEIDLMRAELDMLKRAFRRHCTES